MKHTRLTSMLRRSALALVLLGTLPGAAYAVTYDLVADQFTATMPDGAVVNMWGFASDAGQACGAGGAWAVGPALFVDRASDPSLTINLRNCLPEAVSIVIPSQPGAPALRTNIDGQGRTRVVALANEAATGGTAIYSWANLKSGTYLYSSGSHVAKQVHMGLYGGLFVDENAVAGEAYPGLLYDTSLVLLYSEVDPVLHNAVATATPRDATNWRLNGYRPTYFLVNGQADGGAALAQPSINQRVLIRFLNAGLKDYAPTLLGEYVELVAEDGNLYPYSRTAYGTLLAAGKTIDAVWTPVTPGLHKIYDRRLHLSTGGLPGGGLIASVQVNDVAGVPVANAGPDQIHVAMLTGGLPTVVHLDGSGSSAGVTGYSWTLTSAPAGSVAALGPDPLDPLNPAKVAFTLDLPGSYVAELVVTDGVYTSAPDTVVVFTNLAPVADAGAAQSVFTGDLVTVSGAGSYDPDADPLVGYSWTFVSWPGASAPVLSGAATSSAQFTPAAAGSYVLALVVSDFELTSAPDTVTVTATVNAPSPPVANPDYARITLGTTNNFIDLTSNDTDVDGDLNPNSIVIVTPPKFGSVTVVTGGVLYTPPQGRRGSDPFEYRVSDALGNQSNVALVRVDVVR